MKITPSSNMGNNLLCSFLQHDDYKEPLSLLVKLDRCHIPLLSIVYDIEFHMERKINYFIYFILFIYDFATGLFWTSLYMRKILFTFLSVWFKNISF